MKERNENNGAFPKNEVRTAIREGIEQAQSQMPASEKKVAGPKRRALRKPAYAVAAVAVIFAVLLGSSYYSPALASSLARIPIIGSVFGDSDLIGLKRAQEKGLTSEIHETQTKNGISITLDEILYDQNDITIGWKIKSDRPLDENYFGAGMDFTIDGDPPAATSGSYGETIKSPLERTAIQQITVDESIPDAFELGLVLRGGIGEEWYFTSPISIKAQVKDIAVNHFQSKDGLRIDVDKLRISETGLSVSYKSKERGEDFDLTRGGNVEFHAKDQKGRVIKEHSGGVQGEKSGKYIKFHGNKKFDPIDSDVTELTITPYLALPTGGGGVEIDKDGNEKVIPFKGGSLKPIEFDSFKVKVK